MSAGLSPAIEAGAGDVESAIRHNLAAWEREMWHLVSAYQGPPGAYVVSAQIQPKGDLVALALSNNTVELSPLTEQPAKPRSTLPHDSVVLQLDFTADGRRLLTRTRSSLPTTARPAPPSASPNTALMTSSLGAILTSLPSRVRPTIV